MTYKQMKEKLFDAVQLLMEIYKDVAARAEPLTLAWDSSELKKIRRITC